MRSATGIRRAPAAQWGRRQAPTGQRGEEGVSLIIVLVIVVVLGLIVGVILGEAEVDFTATAGTASIRNLTYAADGGIEYGIAQARSGYCHAPSTASPPALTQLAPGETSPASISMAEPGVNPNVSVSCETATGNSLTNTYGGSEGTPGYSLVTNSPIGGGCVSLDSDAVGQQPNQIKYNAGSNCATYANAVSPDLWSAVNGAPTVSPVPNFDSVYYLDANDAWVVGNNTTILYFHNGSWTQQTCAACANNFNLNAVFAVDATDVWAMGNQAGTPVVLFYNGVTWKLLNTTSAIANGTTLEGAWGAAGVGGVEDLWMVGFNGGNGVAYELTEGAPGQCAVTGGACTVAMQTVPTGTKQLNAVSGSVDSSGTAWLWAVGQGGTILTTTSASASLWTAQVSNTTQNLNGVFALDADDVWAVGNQSNLTTTTDAGSTWSAETFGNGQNLTDIWGYNTGSGFDLWAVGQGPAGPGSTSAIYFYNGATWTAQGGPVANPNLNAVGGVGTSAGDLLVVGSASPNGQTLWTFNGFPQTAGTPTNNGPPWIQQSSGTNQQLNAVTAVPGTTDAWAVGNPQGPTETIVATTNGTTWRAATVSVAHPQALLGVSAADPTHVWAVGNQGQILFYNGSTWTQQASGTTQQLNAVFALNDNDAWAVGNPQGPNYTVLSTVNGGSTWTAATLSPGKAQPLLGVWAADANDVWAVGNQGQIWYYHGGTWTQQASGTTQQLNAVSGVSTSEGASATEVWAVGQNGPAPPPGPGPGPKPGPGAPNGTETILSYQGASWTAVGPSVSGAQPLDGVYAQVDTSSGSPVPNIFAVGNNASIWFSNGGSSWVQQLGAASGPRRPGGPPPPGGGLRAVAAVGTGIGQAWAVGNGGAIWNFNPYSETGMAIDSGGPVFNAGSVQTSSVFWASDSGMVQGGTASCPSNPGIADLYVAGTYSCTSTSQAPVSKTLPPNPASLYGWSCSPQANHNYGPGCLQNPNPPVTHPVGYPGCNLVQFSPGIYGQALNLSQTDTTYFFASGIYYFDNVGHININGTSGQTNGTFIIGGTPASTAESDLIASQSPCWGYASANDPGTTGGANGVEFILGGNSAFQVQAGNIELFTRTGANPSVDGSQAVSIREACSPTGTGLTAPLPCGTVWDPLNIGGNDQILTYAGAPPPPPGGCPTGPGPGPGPPPPPPANCSGPQVDIHGAIYAPDANLDLYSEPNAANLPTIVGAVDVWSLEVGEASYSAPAVEIAGGGPYASRTVILTAYAQGGTGTTPVKEEAEVSLGWPGVDPVTDIETWRSCLPAGTAGTACTG